MKPNPILKKLGYSDKDRLVLLHVDDIGICQAGLEAYQNLVEFGLITCGSIIVPAGWFPAIAAFCREHPNLDIGVHITLTSEWDTFRWRPLSTIKSSSGMLDHEGYFPRTSEEFQENCHPRAAHKEMEKQVEWAQKAGVRLSHVDTHMGTVMHPKLLQSYAKVGFKYHLPIMALRLDRNGWQKMGASPFAAKIAERFILDLEDRGMPLEDRIAFAPLEKPENRMEQYKQVFSELPSGVTHLFIHPALDTPELRAMCPDWRSRVGDYEVFMSNKMRSHIKKEGIHLIGYRTLQALMPGKD